MIPGILCGLVAAFAQSISYIYSKKYIHRDGNSFQLLIASHLITGVFASVLLGLLLLANDLPPFRDYWLLLLAVDGFYLVGQMGFFMAVSRTEASRVAPLLGVKIIFIAVFGVLFLENGISAGQWGAVLLCFGGALLSNWSGKGIPFAAVLWILCAVVGYSLSDICIKKLIECVELENGKGVLSIITAASLAYFYLGIFSLLIIAFMRPLKIRHLKPALPFSCFWFAAMLFLFTSFALIGPLFGNIVQSVRGIIAVILGAALARLHLTEYEEKLPYALLFRRIAAALLICVSIVIFALA
ncbi:MAG: DMT family transporter [Victivallaceae bacterium]|nr:DMT family transporter [Victivallaceae bacterium]